MHVVMGASGAGKSTLLKCLGGVWRPQGGDVLLDGASLWESSNFAGNAAALQRIGFAFQNNALFTSMRVIENLSYPHRQRFPHISEKTRQAIAMEWLAKVGLEASALLYPHELSGGMQKRLAIARALILNADCLFLDDPTAGLDPITSRQISKLLLSLLKESQALVVLVTNDADRARSWSQNIHFLADKKLHSPGTSAYAELQRKFLIA